jgi:hypothetical protein
LCSIELSGFIDNQKAINDFVVRAFSKTQISIFSVDLTGIICSTQIKNSEWESGISFAWLRRLSLFLWQSGFMKQCIKIVILLAGLLVFEGCSSLRSPHRPIQKQRKKKPCYECPSWSHVPQKNLTQLLYEG